MIKQIVNMIVSALSAKPRETEILVEGTLSIKDDKLCLNAEASVEGQAIPFPISVPFKHKMTLAELQNGKLLELLIGGLNNSSEQEKADAGDPAWQEEE